MRTLPMFPATLLMAAAVTLSAQDIHVRVSPDVKTGIEGKTEFPKIQNALDHHPNAGVDAQGRPGRVYIEIEPGVYHERIIVTQNHRNITLVGMGKSPAEVVITNSLNASQAGGTFFTETAEINGDGFAAVNLTIENTAGNTGQAVAAAVRADRAIFKHCRLLGHQDTLFADAGRQYYVDSYIEGGVDFIFGNAAAVFERDELHFNGPGYLTAHSRSADDQPTGYVVIDSRVTADLGAEPPAGGAGSGSSAAAKRQVYLGRPWRPYARVVYIRTILPAELAPEGWNNWGKESNEKTAWFGENGNTGINLKTVAAWSHQLTAEEAGQFSPKAFLAGSDGWEAASDAARLP